MTALFPPHVTRLETVVFLRDAAELAGGIGPRTRARTHLRARLVPATALEGVYGPGGTVFLCLNGPSFDERTQQQLARRPGVATFCVNNGAHGYRPDLWACVDAPERFMDSIWMDRTVMKPLSYVGNAP